MPLSERAAIELLWLKAGLDRTGARDLLRTGIAARPQRADDGRLLYDEQRVTQLAGRRVWRPAALAEVLPLGAAFARFVPARPWDATADAAARLATLGGPWALSAAARLALNAYIDVQGFYPLIGAVSGFFVAGADIVAAPGWSDEPTTLTLAAPGAWYTPLAEGRWLTGRGGRPLYVWRTG